MKSYLDKIRKLTEKLQGSPDIVNIDFDYIYIEYKNEWGDYDDEE